MADQAKVKQILLNLLSNAIKFTSDCGSVTVAGELIPGYLQIAISDTGCGISPEHQERIFGEFEQIDSSYARTQQGTGLGLALTKKFVEMHGGRIWLESRGAGHGSTFSFAIPMKADLP
jgi:signal transduction histidine kinase